MESIYIKKYHLHLAKHPCLDVLLLHLQPRWVLLDNGLNDTITRKLIIDWRLSKAPGINYDMRQLMTYN